MVPGPAKGDPSEARSAFISEGRVTRPGAFQLPDLEPILPGMIDALTDAVAVVDRDRRVVAANRRYLEVFGARGDEVVGYRCGQVLRCPEREHGDPDLGCPACAAMRELQPQRIIRSVPSPDGSQRRWEATFNPIVDGDGKPTHVVEVWRDISDRSALEAQLSHSERLASVGILAAGVAHEINNPLASLLAGAESLQRLLERAQMSEETRTEALEIAQLLQYEVMRCRGTTEKLMLLAQPIATAPGWFDLNHALRDTASLLHYQMRRQGVELVEELDPTLPQIWARGSGLRGVCMNLMLNAVQAMGEGGRLTLRTRHAGERVEMAIEDTGPGISPEHFERIFDPFFTTKPPGKGTGLGLSVTHGVVRRHGGSIRAENRREGGARFVVALPARGPAGSA